MIGRFVTERSALEIATEHYLCDCPRIAAWWLKIARRMRGDGSNASAHYGDDEWRLGVETGGEA